MAINRRIQCLICYDIADPKRLQRLHRLVSQCAVMIQYSVYHAVLTQREIKQLLDEIKERIDPKEDDVRIYPLPHQLRVDMLGVSDTLCLLLSMPSPRISSQNRRRRVKR